MFTTLYPLSLYCNIKRLCSPLTLPHEETWYIGLSGSAFQTSWVLICVFPLEPLTAPVGVDSCVVDLHQERCRADKVTGCFSARSILLEHLLCDDVTSPYWSAAPFSNNLCAACSAGVAHSSFPVGSLAALLQGFGHSSRAASVLAWTQHGVPPDFVHPLSEQQQLHPRFKDRIQLVESLLDKTLGTEYIKAFLDCDSQVTVRCNLPTGCLVHITSSLCWNDMITTTHCGNH